ncbi:MAG: hypothetical protein KJ578_09620 [Bacteroidetes bacterium]|nr:hypothetical protein [Bacteroidota bacterium]
MNMLFKKIILSVVIISSLLSCTTSSDNFKEPIISEVSATFKSYTVFDTNSFWVYRNQLNSKIDTLTVSDLYMERRFHNPLNSNPGFYYNAYELLYLSDEIGIVRGEVTGGYADDATDSLPENYRIYFQNGRYFSILTPKYTIGEEQLLGINEGNYTNVAFYNNFELDGRAYSGVYQVLIKDYFNENDTSYLHFYLAKNVGIIRYQRYTAVDSVDWILNSYDVNVLTESRWEK